VLQCGPAPICCCEVPPKASHLERQRLPDGCSVGVVVVELNGHDDEGKAQAPDEARVHLLSVCVCVRVCMCVCACLSMRVHVSACACVREGTRTLEGMVWGGADAGRHVAVLRPGLTHHWFTWEARQQDAPTIAWLGARGSRCSMHPTSTQCTHHHIYDGEQEHHAL